MVFFDNSISSWSSFKPLLAFQKPVTKMVSDSWPLFATFQNVCACKLDCCWLHYCLLHTDAIMEGAELLQCGQEESSILEDVQGTLQDHVQALETVLLLLTHRPLMLNDLQDNARISF